MLVGFQGRVICNYFRWGNLKISYKNNRQSTHEQDKPQLCQNVKASFVITKQCGLLRIKNAK